jgi:hypothetical protein
LIKHTTDFLSQNVWWPLMGSFEHLHPEYEVYDWNRKSQFLDFAFVVANAKFGIEIDGFQSHIKDMDREKHSYALNRDNFLTGIGWKMLHFSFDDVQRRPDIAQMLLQLALAPYLIRSQVNLAPTLHAHEREVLRPAWSLGRSIRPIDVKNALQINFRTARNRLQALAAKGLLEPLSTGNGVRRYRLTEYTPTQLTQIFE